MLTAFSDRFPGKERCSLRGLIFIMQCVYLGSKLLANKSLVHLCNLFIFLHFLPSIILHTLDEITVKKYLVGFC